jgi:uncharacterized Fe-S cluster-containing radical SAM superfamily enzyme
VEGASPSMVREISLSDYFPIEAEIENGSITIFVNRLVTGKVSLAQLESQIRSELATGQSKLGIIVKGGELLIAIDAPPGTTIDEPVIARTVGNLISKLLPTTLRNRVTGKKLVYVTRASGIPLMGRIDFGLIDRGTNLIQVRPITGCVLDCPFCSVDSGTSSKTRVTDFIVDGNYLTDEARKLCEFKGSKSIELHIDGQGEPTLYPDLSRLIRELSNIKGVEIISLQTNGTLLTKELVDDLQNAGLSRINLSLNSLDSEIAATMSGSLSYNLRHLIDVIEYVMESSISLLIAPLWVPGLNDNEIAKIVQFVKKLGIRSKWPVLGIQNYLVHRHGKKVKGVKPFSMQHFRYRLDNLTRVYGTPNLVLRRSDFGIRQMESYAKPFTVGEIAEVEIVEPGRLIGEMVGVGRGRALHVLTTEREVDKGRLIRIVRTKHNIFVGETIKKHSASGIRKYLY